MVTKRLLGISALKHAKVMKRKTRIPAATFAITTSSSSPSLFASSSSLSSATASKRNRIYTSVRNPNDLDTLLLLSSSSRKPLLTLWTASWCPLCKTVAPLIKTLLEDEGVGEREGGIGYAEVEMDAMDNMYGELGMRYLITSLPTLLSFAKQRPRLETKITRLEQLKDRSRLIKWIEDEARMET